MKYAGTNVAITQLIIILSLIVMSLFFIIALSLNYYRKSYSIKLILFYIFSVFSKIVYQFFIFFQFSKFFFLLKTHTVEKSVESIRLKFIQFFLISNYLLIEINWTNSIKDLSCDNFLNIYEVEKVARFLLFLSTVSYQ